MGKSLTEVAKKILSESNDAAPDRDARKMTPNAGTLRPRSKSSDGVMSNPGAMAPSAPNNKVQDLGPALVSQGDVPPSAKASGSIGKDTSSSSQSRKGAVPAEKSKKQTEVMEEDYELDEEQLDEVSIKTAAQALSNLDANRGEGHYRGKRAARSNRQKEKFEKYLNKKMPGRGQAYNDEKLDEEIEISEELEDFINEMIEEGYSEDEISAAIDENFELVELEEEFEEEYDYQVDMSEHIEALFAGEELSEEFKAKAIAIFEAAVKQKIDEEIAIIEQAYSETIEEQVEQIKEELSSDVDDYLNYVVEQWVSENEVAIEAGLRTELTEEFISGLRQLFAEHYIDIPEDKISVVSEMAEKVVELEEKLNEEIENNVVLNKMLSESTRNEVLFGACDGLTVTQAEKLKSLAEGIEFTTADEYSQKINILRESYFSSTPNTGNVLDNVEVSEGGQVLKEETGRMSAYTRALGRTLPK